AYMHPDTEPGSYVRLKVSDSGDGMDAETVERAFEPFYTTKEDGTGLGLATVYGSVTGAGGRIDIYSEPGIGTTVKVHLPVAGEDPEAPSGNPQASPMGKGQVVLVVEDEPEVRRMSERILTKGGYAVIGEERGGDAVGICEAWEQPIDLLLTDVIMPEMLGTELVDRIRAIRPEMKVIYMSGYSHEVLAPAALLGNGSSAFLEKPFSSRDLLVTVDRLLAGDDGQAADDA
ncbi:MAG: response regulator, partial [Solirubrobacterales bacterium]